MMVIFSDGGQTSQRTGANSPVETPSLILLEDGRILHGGLNREV